MLLRVFTEPQQGASYDDLLAVAQKTEECGFDAFFRSDHYLVQGDGDGLPGPTDAWITLAALARETSRIRLGTLVSPVTFRNPAVLAITVAQVDQMSGSRVEPGLGAGRRRLEVYGDYADEVKAGAVVGTPAEVVDRLGRFAATGADRAYLQIPVLADLDHLDLIASEVLPHLT
jgi:alkanesulfonate monooxygenase SsuD/methylene tetrahydromethanopterin reductase-like flavin-dependent oxidoreductase (luciferase family)